MIISDFDTSHNFDKSFSNNYVLSFAFAFDRDEEKYQFALAYPYSYSRWPESGIQWYFKFICSLIQPLSAKQGAGFHPTACGNSSGHGHQRGCWQDNCKWFKQGFRRLASAHALSSAREEPGSVDHHWARAGWDWNRPPGQEGEDKDIGIWGALSLNCRLRRGWWWWWLVSIPERVLPPTLCKVSSTSSSPSTRLLRSWERSWYSRWGWGPGVTFQFQVIPMMNPDGVYLGNYRGSLLGEWIECTKELRE